MAKKTAKAPAFPLFGDLTEKKMRALGAKLDKLQDVNGFKHYDLLSKSTDGPNQSLLWHLVRCGLVAQDPHSAGLYRQLGEYIPADVSADDVIAVLRHVPEDMGALDRGRAREHAMLTPGVLSEIDALLVHAYLRDPAAIRAVQPELPESLQVAIECVRRRAGEAIDPGRARVIFEHLAHAHAATGIAYNIDVPRIVDGPASSVASPTTPRCSSWRASSGAAAPGPSSSSRGPARGWPNFAARSTRCRGASPRGCRSPASAI